MTHPRLRGILATLAIAGFVAGVPAVLITIGAAPWNLDLASVPGLLTRRDDGTLALILLTLGAWIAWSVVAATLLAEIAAAIRGVHLPTVPGLAIPQHAASELVAVAALAFATVPTVATTLPSPTAHAAPATLPEAGPAIPAETPQPASTKTTPAGGIRTESAVPTIDYVVRRGDSLWRIAERHLGDGARYPEVATLNSEVLGGRPDFIRPGTVLRLPDVRPATTEHGPEHVVRSGDTLWDIADRELGDPHRYREIFDLSRDTIQPDGERLSDPDLIRPGWILTLPAHPASAAKLSDHETESRAPQEASPPVAPRSVEMNAGQDATYTVDVEESEPDMTPAVDESEPAHAWLVSGLSAGGVALAGCVLMTIRGHRRTQLRYRKPGQVLAPTPTELRPIEKTAISEGTTMADTLDFVDRALRHLAATLGVGTGEPIGITHATLGRHELNLHLSQPRQLPTPWTSAGAGWAISLAADVDDVDVIPPCPMLVSVGGLDSGELLLVNLECFGTVGVGGDPTRAAALARHLVAELALSPWALVAQLHTVDIATEFGDMVRFRLDHGAADDSEYIGRVVGEIRASQKAGAGDPDPFRAVVTASPVGFEDLSEIISAPGPRLGAVLVNVGAATSGHEALMLNLDEEGRLHIEQLGLELDAAGLTAEEAKACAAIVEVTRDTPSMPIPTFAEDADGWRAHVDQAGALREELTEPRGEGPAGDDSLLPGDTDDYVQAAATTAEDVETLAPVVPEAVSSSVLESDPNLDDDLTEWHDPRSRLPKLTLLGPVGLRARSAKPPHSKTRPQLIEILSYIALHPEGVVSRELSEAFGRSVSRLRTDVGTIRDWLGTNPRTSQPHLPHGDASKIYRATKTAGYQVEDLLIDLDLFRRLRARGQARGDEGVEDLLAALRLVTGQPFSEVREKGWTWLQNADRIHEIAASAIADTAHLVVTHAMATGDAATAREAVEIARRACPFDEVSRLDQARVAVAEGAEETAEGILDQDIFNRTDNHEGPIEAPDRTSQVYIGRPTWSSTSVRRTS